jgi:hypothetical protein
MNSKCDLFSELILDQRLSECGMRTTNGKQADLQGYAAENRLLQNFHWLALK